MRAPTDGGDRGSGGERVRTLVGSEGLSFRGRDDAERLGDVVKFRPQLAQRASLRPRGKAEGMSREECLS